MKVNLSRSFTLRFVPLLLFVLILGIPSITRAFTVSPPRLEINVDPGQTYSGTYTVYNDTNAKVTYYSSFENFEAQGEDGTPKFTTANTGLASWIRGPKTLELKPQEEKKVDYSILVPKNATPGGYFAAVFWGQNPPATDSGTSTVSSRVGILVLLSVKGNVDEIGGIKEFSLVDQGSFATMLPVHVAYRFSNSGGDRLFPKGKLSISGITRENSIDANQSGGNVLPHTIRKFDITWGEPHADKMTLMQTIGYQAKNFAIGPYKIKLHLEYGNKTTTSADESLSVFILPIHLLLFVLILLLIVFFGGRYLIRSYNKRIIKMAMKYNVSAPSTSSVQATTTVISSDNKPELIMEETTVEKSE